MFEYALQILAVGLIATMCMDVWSAIIPKIFTSVADPDWRPVGRWVFYLFKGKYAISTYILDEAILSVSHTRPCIDHFEAINLSVYPFL